MNGGIIFTALVCSGLEGMIIGPVQQLFAYPSAYVSSVFLGVSPVFTEGREVLIPVSHQFINVTSKCSAFGFFCLLSAVLMIRMIPSLQKQKILTALVLSLPPAYLITVAANGVRIICAYYTYRIGRLILPPNFQPALHQGVGIAVFLSTLIAVTLILERIPRHE